MPQNRTESQKSAARINGAKSHGPTSRMGKRIASRNNLKHGLLADVLLLPDESREAFLALSTNFFDVFRPTNDLEDLYVQRMVEAEWRLVRIRDYETAALMVQISAEGSHPEIPIDDRVWTHHAARGAAAFQRVHAGGIGGSILQTSKMRYLREFKEAQTQLFRLREHATRWRIPEYEPGDLVENIHATPLPKSEPGPAPHPPPPDVVDNR